MAGSVLRIVFDENPVPVRSIIAEAARSAIHRGYVVEVTYDGGSTLLGGSLHHALTDILARVDETAETHPVCLSWDDVEAIRKAIG